MGSEGGGRERGSGRAATSWQCKDNELVALNVADDDNDDAARQCTSQMSVKGDGEGSWSRVGGWC